LRPVGCAAQCFLSVAFRFAAMKPSSLRKMGGDPADYPLWLITTKSMQYSAGNNAGIPLMNEVGRNMRGHGGVILNAATANRLGIRQGDPVEVRSITGSTRGSAVLE
jgi:phenylacetyl-CoA:acceptor oxidoreductase